MSEERWSKVEIWFGPHAPEGDDAEALFDALADVAHTAKLPDGCDPYVSGTMNAPTPEWAQG